MMRFLRLLIGFDFFIMQCCLTYSPVFKFILLFRLIVDRAEADLVEVKEHFARKYPKSLADSVKVLNLASIIAITLLLTHYI